METLFLSKDINVFGFTLSTFPEGISEAFDSFVKIIPEGLNRSYFGISRMEDGKMIYIVAVEEKNAGEAKKYKLERYTIPRGLYNKITIHNWREKLASVKEAFHNMMSEKNVDTTQPCIEWYKNEEEMECMVKRIS
jgi:predicted transcriptional regulator YdeE